ncbi:MAG: MBL fold metallo-hydrolase, partial [Burkholderiales bacterium]
MRRIVLSGLACVLALCALPARAVDAIRITPNVYYIRGEAGVPSPVNRGHTSNAGFVVTTDGVVVFDALGPP